MAYTTNQLISSSYYASGVVSRQFETVNGTQLADGLDWLNDIISDKTVDQGMVPYEGFFPFKAIPGQQVYYIPNLVQIDTLVFFLDDVRYPMKYTQRNDFFGSARVENIQTLPYEWYWERKFGGGNLHIYFAPDQSYPMEIHGVFRMAQVALGQDLTSDVTTANLGNPIIYGDGYLAQNQLLINGVDMMGNYFNIGALVNYINSGVVPGVEARYQFGNVILSTTTQPASNIFIQTSGYPPNGTSFISNVAVATDSALPTNSYNNGSQGVGATLTAVANGALIIDGYSVVVSDRIIVKDEANEAYNGLYTVTQVGSVGLPYILTRSTNYDESVQISNGDLFTTLNGFFTAGKTFIQTADVSYVGFSDIIFEEFNALSFSGFSTIEQYNSQLYISQGLDEFYISYLKYALADRICTEYNYEVPLGVAKQLRIYEAWIKKKSRILDLTMDKTSTLQKRTGLNWAIINIGRGFLPPG